jgi:hypothetical protein
MTPKTTDANEIRSQPFSGAGRRRPSPALYREQRTESECIKAGWRKSKHGNGIQLVGERSCAEQRSDDNHRQRESAKAVLRMSSAVTVQDEP